MSNILENLLTNKELKDRIIFTFVMFVIFRLGVHIPVPGVDASVIESLFSAGNLFGFLDLFAGGALSKFSIFAMSITPYINASIIIQLLTVAIPSLENLAKEAHCRRPHVRRVEKGRSGRVQEDPEDHALRHGFPRFHPGIRHGVRPSDQQCSRGQQLVLCSFHLHRPYSRHLPAYVDR